MKGMRSFAQSHSFPQLAGQLQLPKQRTVSSRIAIEVKSGERLEKLTILNPKREIRTQTHPPGTSLHDQQAHDILHIMFMISPADPTRGVRRIFHDGRIKCFLRTLYAVR